MSKILIFYESIKSDSLFPQKERFIFIYNKKAGILLDGILSFLPHLKLFSSEQLVGESNPCFRRERATS